MSKKLQSPTARAEIYGDINYGFDLLRLTFGFTRPQDRPISHLGKFVALLNARNVTYDFDNVLKIKDLGGTATGHSNKCGTKANRQLGFQKWRKVFRDTVLPQLEEMPAKSFHNSERKKFVVCIRLAGEHHLRCQDSNRSS